VIGVKDLCSAIVDNDRIVVDGDSGEVVLHPSADALEVLSGGRKPGRSG